MVVVPSLAAGDELAPRSHVDRDIFRSNGVFAVNSVMAFCNDACLDDRDARKDEPSSFFSNVPQNPTALSRPGTLSIPHAPPPAQSVAILAGYDSRINGCMESGSNERRSRPSRGERPDIILIFEMERPVMEEAIVSDMFK